MKITNVTVPDKSQFEGLKLLAASSATIDAVFVTREGNEAFLARHADAAVVIEFKIHRWGTSCKRCGQPVFYDEVEEVYVTDFGATTCTMFTSSGETAAKHDPKTWDDD